VAHGAVQLALTGLVAGCGGSDPQGAPIADFSVSDDDGMHGVVLPDPYELADVSLTATDGSSYRFRSDTDQPLTLIFFGYTHCPDICQVVMANIASSLTRLDPAQRAKVQMEFVTTDPARDDSRTLRAYVDRFDPSFDGLTGDLPTIVRLGKAFDVPIEKGAKLPSGGYDVAHGTQILGLLPDHRAPFVWTQGTDPSTLADDITTILDDKVPGL
jgi:protein SCO1/2